MHIAIKSESVDHMDSNSPKIIEDHIANGHTSSDNNEEPIDTKGGRLKFFKDGKMILELTHAKFGEKVSWIKVSNGTFWPPHGLVTTTARLENCTSDDNSSLQSSPWQRDHSWKQIRPKRWKSTQLNVEFMYCKSKNEKSHQWLLNLSQKKLSRNPYQEVNLKLNKCQKCNRIQNECEMNQCNKNNNNNRIPKSLESIIKNLIGRFHQTQTVIHRSICSGGELLSPTASPSSRKRILKEFDRVSLLDDSNSNIINQNNTNGGGNGSSGSGSGSVMNSIKIGSSCNHNCNEIQQSLNKKRARCISTKSVPTTNKTDEKTSFKNTNYSISSLLSRKDSTETISCHEKFFKNMSTNVKSSPTSTTVLTTVQTATTAVSSATVASLDIIPTSYYSEFSLLQSYLLTSPPIAHQHNSQVYLNNCNRSDLFYSYHNHHSHAHAQGNNNCQNYFSRSLPLNITHNTAFLHTINNNSDSSCSDAPLNLSKHSG